jgi:hypothetical protein
MCCPIWEGLGWSGEDTPGGVISVVTGLRRLLLDSKGAQGKGCLISFPLSLMPLSCSELKPAVLAG